MIAVLSPAKTLNFDYEPSTSKHTTPDLIEDATYLAERLRVLSPSQLQSLMDVNEEIATLNHDRFAEWGSHRSLEDGLQAIFAYAGEVYRGLDVSAFSAEDLYYAQNHLRILSGLYGAVRPLDIIRPYRLEMGTPFSTDRGRNLYEFWGSRITEALNGSLHGHSSHVVVNLASKEYFSSVGSDHLNGTVISPTFKENRDGKYRIIAVYAKNARGRMARFMIKNRIDDPEGLRSFNEDGYSYSPELSTDSEWVYTR